MLRRFKRRGHSSGHRGVPLRKALLDWVESRFVQPPCILASVLNFDWKRSHTRGDVRYLGANNRADEKLNGGPRSWPRKGGRIFYAKWAHTQAQAGIEEPTHRIPGLVARQKHRVLLDESQIPARGKGKEKTSCFVGRRNCCQFYGIRKAGLSARKHLQSKGRGDGLGPHA